MKILKIIGSKVAYAFYSLPRILFINFYRSFLRIRISNPKKIPRDHSVIFAFNHTTGADPIIALSALRRKIYFIADSERFTNRFTTFFMRKCANSTPIFKNETRKNIKSFKELFSISMDKRIFFGIFPEGDLYKKGKFGKFHDGAAYLSFKTKIPIVPVYMHNLNLGPTDEGWVERHPVFEGIASLFTNTFRRIHVFFGDPIDPMAENIMEELSGLTDKKEYKNILDKITKQLEKEFLELKEEAEIFSISKNSERINNSQIKNSTSPQKPAVILPDNSKVENIKAKKIRVLNNNAGKPQIAPALENLNPDELVSFKQDEELIVSPANAK